MTQEKIQQLSERMLPTPIKVGQVKKFRLLGAGQHDPLTGLPSFNTGAIFEGITTVYDIGKKEPVILKNITGKSIKKDKDGKEVVEEVISTVEFNSSGIAYVDHTQPETYVFLSRDNRCITNPFRDKTKEAMWEEIIENRHEEKQRFLSDLKYEALKLIKESSIKDVIAIGKTLTKGGYLTVNLDGPPSDVRWAIEKVCDKNPEEVIKAGKELLPKIKIDIQDAVNFGELEFQADGNTWVFAKEHENKEICQVEPGKDPLETLAKHLLAEEEAMEKKPKEEKVKTTLQRIKGLLKEASVGAL